ncbi:hypothetical protein [Fimbriiglobus ruber]|uniref:Uncharacterized protein n=1 Tax=Fimbriiglobus ruber TaxID=1908690 RepID=A0A225DKW2_9BACT|nr:hypothetical protein [Fimbriiglobus ruber]OWK42081.1 hypothetical protein FRUB_04159 [Fimbriiglobus ruber]
MSILSSLEAFFSSTETKIEDVLTPFEHSLLKKFHPLFQQIEATLGTQGLQIVDDAATGLLTTAATGGNIAAGITAAATQALGQIESDAKADAKNAVYGVLAATVASLPAPAEPAAPTPAPTPAV